MTTDHSRLLTRASAVSIAHQWHGGGGSPLYRFASHGGLVLSEKDRVALVAEILGDIAGLEGYPSEEQAREAPKLLALLEFVEAQYVEEFVK